METRLYPCRQQPVILPSSFETVFPNIVVFFGVFARVFHDFKTSTILVYMVLNGKGSLTGYGLHGCGLHGCGLASFLLTGAGGF